MNKPNTNYFRSLKNSSRSTAKSVIQACLFLSVVFLGVWVFVAKDFLPWNFNLTSEIGPALRVFYFNQSHTATDPVPNCWKDSGDNIVFLHRNLESLYTLSLAYKLAKTAPVKADIAQTIRQQLRCTDELLAKNIKQIRDQRSHGVILPPILDDIRSPQVYYKFEQQEGKDAFLLRARISQNLGDKDEAEWLKKANTRNKRTVSAHCCEEGPLQLSDGQFVGLQVLSKTLPENTPQQSHWSVDFGNLARLQNKNTSGLNEMLSIVQNRWSQQDSPFNYLGGNYDIAGTIAIERMYAAQTGDQQYKKLSERLLSYLQGKNELEIDFTQVKPFHSCGTWWSWCQLKQTLVNGKDEQGQFKPTSKKSWRYTEVQLVGQAKYVLALVLIKNL